MGFDKLTCIKEIPTNLEILCLYILFLQRLPYKSRHFYKSTCYPSSCSGIWQRAHIENLLLLYNPLVPSDINQ